MKEGLLEGHDDDVHEQACSLGLRYLMLAGF